MNHAIRTTAALLALVGAVGLAQAQGGPGDSGAGSSGPNGSASGTTGNGTGPTAARSKPAKVAHAKRARGTSDAASGAKADGPMSNTSTGKGG